MSQPQPHQRPEEEGGAEGKPAKSPSPRGKAASREGVMAALRGAALLRALAAAPLAAPTAAAIVAGAATVAASSAAEAGPRSLELPPPPAEEPPPPARTGGGGHRGDGSPAPAAGAKLEERLKTVEDAMALLRREVCTKYGLAPDCSDATLKTEIEKGDPPLTKKDLFLYLMLLLAGLAATGALIGVPAWIVHKLRAPERKIEQIFKAFGVEEDMRPSEVRLAFMDDIKRHFRGRDGHREEEAEEGEEGEER